MALLHLRFCWSGLVKNEKLQSPNPKDRKRESHPCVNLRQEKLSRLLLTCVRLRFVSCTSNLLAQMFGFRKCTEFLLMLTSSLRGLLQNQNFEIILICIVCQCFPHDNTVCIHMYDEWLEIKRHNRLSRAVVHFVIDRASLFADHRISGRSIRAKCRHFRTICEQTVDTYFSHGFQFFFFEMMVVHAWRRDFLKLLRHFIRQFAISFHAFLCMTFHVVGP